MAAQAAIEFFLRGAVILDEGGGPVTHLRIIHSGGVDIMHEGRLLDLLGPGDAFGHAAMLSGLPPGFEARAAEDTLCYRIPVEVARPLLDRARRSELRSGRTDVNYQPVVKLIRAATVTCKPSENIGFVAERMTAAGVSAAVVELEEGGWGMLTDRDLRARVLAVGRSGAVRVDAAMTAPAYIVSPDRLAGEVLYEMLERGIRHAPVVSERRASSACSKTPTSTPRSRGPGSVRGATSSAPATSRRCQRRRPSCPPSCSTCTTPACRRWSWRRVLSALVDALTRRAIELASANGAGAEPGTVWVSLGSQARRELTPASTRRGAVIHDPQRPPSAEWVQAVEAALTRCGVVGPLVAHDAQGWAARAGADELALSVLADRRVLWGTPREPLPLATGPARAALLEALAAGAFTPALPTGFDADAVLTREGRQSRLNVRAAAIVPIAAIARWAAAAADAGEGSTPSGSVPRPMRGCWATTRRRPSPRPSSWPWSCASCTSSTRSPPARLLTTCWTRRP